MHRDVSLTAVFRRLALVLCLSLSGASAVHAQAEAVPGDPLTGSGAVERTLLRAADLLGGSPPVGPVAEDAFALPAAAAHPVHTWSGRLELVGESRSRNHRPVRELFGVDRVASRRYLPEFDFAFVQHGSHLIPVRRGLVITGRGFWHYIVEPGRVWREDGDGDHSRAAFPFALVQRNQNCVLNGVMSFLFNDREVSRVWYQITLETCYYMQADFWGLLDAVYHRAPVPGQNRLRRDYVSEVKDRFPTRPIARLAADYPDLDAAALTHGVTPEYLTTYGLVAPSGGIGGEAAAGAIHYAGPCRSRYGAYAGVRLQRPGRRPAACHAR